MDVQTFLLSLTIVALVAIAGIAGLALFEKRNYLLAALWLMMAFSGLNFLFFGLYGESAAFGIANLCDQFVKGIGLPVLVTAGLMTVTHRYRLSGRASMMFLGAALAVSVLLEAVEALAPLRPFLRAAAWAVFSCYLWYFARRLADIGEYFHAFGVAMVLLGAQAVAVLAGAVDEKEGSDRLLYYMFEAAAAAYLCLELFFAYCALERSAVDSDDSGPFTAHP